MLSASLSKKEGGGFGLVLLFDYLQVVLFAYINLRAWENQSNTARGDNEPSPVQVSQDLSPSVVVIKFGIRKLILKTESDD